MTELTKKYFDRLTLLKEEEYAFWNEGADDDGDNASEYECPSCTEVTVGAFGVVCAPCVEVIHSDNGEDLPF